MVRVRQYGIPRNVPQGYGRPPIGQRVRSGEVSARPHPGRMLNKGRLLIALALAAFALFSYYRSGEKNPVTGEKQYISISPKQEIALGLQAAPKMAAQHGGEHPDPRVRQMVSEIGQRLVASSAASKTPYRFQFHALADPKTVNAFALPGGQIFITHALLDQLSSEGQIAGVLGHEIVHVVARHGAQRMAKQQLTSGLAGAVAVGAGSQGSGQMAQMIAQMVNMKYGREDELESDTLGVKFMADAGYDPNAMIGVQEVLKKASGGGRSPEFFSTHPNPDNRIGRIKETIKRLYPNGVPRNLKP